jgi:hypothetical protein
MKNSFILPLAIALLCVMACSHPNDSGSEQRPATGAIAGKAVYKGGTDHSGIVITLESTDGLRAASVTASAGRSALSRSVAASTVTGSDGSYRFDGVVSGMYTVYAVSRNATEKAVTTNVAVFPGQTSSAGELLLTLTGGFTGKVEVNGEEANAGVLVFVANTSFMAMTDSAGNFTISDVPANEAGYQVIAMKGSHTAIWGTFTVQAGTAKDLGTLRLDVANESTGIQWKGSLDTAPANPEVNWAYYDTVQKKSFIWDGAAWRMIAQDGEKGEPGTSGKEGAALVWKGALASAPQNPETNWAYYDTVQKASFVWDGQAWQILSVDGDSVSPIFIRFQDMSAWLSKQQGGNSPSDPIYVAYIGNETFYLLFSTLDTVKKYVDLDMSLCDIKSISPGEEAGRRYIVSISLPRDFIAAGGSENNPSFKNFDNLVSITGDVLFGAYACTGLPNLRSVAVSNYHGSIGTGAFMGCINLSSVEMPLGSISEKSFAGCVSLTSINIEYWGYIYEEAFSGCTGLVSVNAIGTTHIRPRAFKDCTSLVSLTTGMEETSIQVDVFSGAAITERTITIYIPSYRIELFQSNYRFGLNRVVSYFWDQNSPYRNNLNVALAPIP